MGVHKSHQKEVLIPLLTFFPRPSLNLSHTLMMDFQVEEACGLSEMVGISSLPHLYLARRHWTHSASLLFISP